MRAENKAKVMAFCKKIAQKNKFCLNLAAIILVVYIIVDKILYINRYKLARISCLALICIAFLVESSFAPMSFDDGNYDITNYEDVVLLDSEEANEEDYLITKVENEEDMASYDDLLATVEEQSLGEDYLVNSKDGFDKNDWNLLLVNKTHSIPDDYSFTLGVIKGSMKCDERILGPLKEMFEGANSDGVNLVVCSPYRDTSRQEYLFDRKIKNYINKGYSYIDAYRLSAQEVTVPGSSEHQIGISLDILCEGYNVLNEGFGDTQAGKWLAENSYKYGFILRYPKGKENITGIMYEPWHFRYVGVEAATQIYEKDITLEEFIEEL